MLPFHSINGGWLPSPRPMLHKEGTSLLQTTRLCILVGSVRQKLTKLDSNNLAPSPQKPVTIGHSCSDVTSYQSVQRVN